MEQAPAVLVRRVEGIARVGRDGVVSGRGLSIHRGQAAPERTTVLHFHAVRQRHLILDRIFLVHSR